MGNRQLIACQDSDGGWGRLARRFGHHLCSIVVAALVAAHLWSSRWSPFRAREVAGRDTPLISAMTTCFFQSDRSFGPVVALSHPERVAGSLCVSCFLPRLLSSCTLIRGPAPLAKSPQKNTFGSPADPIHLQLHSPSYVVAGILVRIATPRQM
jgi:hypothetical protein